MSIDMPMVPETLPAEVSDIEQGDVPDTVQQADGHTQSQTSNTTVLIAEADVLFGTAAATGLRRKDRSWISVWRRLFAAAPSDSRPNRRHYPARMDFLEDSRMAREMLRL